MRGPACRVFRVRGRVWGRVLPVFLVRLVRGRGFRVCLVRRPVLRVFPLPSTELCSYATTRRVAPGWLLSLCAKVIFGNE